MSFTLEQMENTLFNSLLFGWMTGVVTMLLINYVIGKIDEHIDAREERRRSTTDSR